MELKIIYGKWSFFKSESAHNRPLKHWSLLIYLSIHSFPWKSFLDRFSYIHLQESLKDRWSASSPPRNLPLSWFLYPSTTYMVPIPIPFLRHTFLFSHSIQFSSVAQSCLTLYDPMNRSMPGLPVHHQLPEFTQTHTHWVLMPSSHLILFSSCPQSLPASESFPMSQLFTWGGQSAPVIFSGYDNFLLKLVPYIEIRTLNLNLFLAFLKKTE